MNKYNNLGFPFFLFAAFVFFSLSGCFLDSPKQPLITEPVEDSSGMVHTEPPAPISEPEADVIVNPSFGDSIATGNIPASSVLAFAKTLTGTPYLYGSAQPEKGLDCSGFITYVFNHFGIAVPRSSIQFTHIGKTVSPAEALPGDLILFTGTDSASALIGHMGIVTQNSDSLRFIHSTSGKQQGVTISAMTPGYQRRFVRIARVFNNL